MHRVSAQNEDSRFKQAAANFSLQRYRSARQNPVQNGVLGLEKQLQLFRFLYTNMAALSFFFISKKMAACIFSVCFQDIKTSS
jgi:hypothetical protein